MTDGEVGDALFQMAQAIRTQARAITTQGNREVVPRKNQHAITMASCLKDYTRVNPAIFLGSKVHDDPQDFVDEV